HLPAVCEQALREVAAADPRHAHDERTLRPTVRRRHRGFRLALAARLSSCSLSADSGTASAPRRPRTTQIARTVSGPSLMRRCGVDDGNVIESPARSTYSSKPTTTRSVP